MAANMPTFPPGPHDQAFSNSTYEFANNSLHYEEPELIADVLGEN
jgi:hypothetical protein